MYQYVILNENNIVISTVSMSMQPESFNEDMAPNRMLEVDFEKVKSEKYTYFDDLSGQYYDGKNFVDPPAKTYPFSLVITNIQAMSVNDDKTEVTCKVGDTITVKAKLTDFKGKKVSLSDSFRMPIRTRDGKEELCLVSIQNGEAELNLTMDTSGAWQVTRDYVNEALPEEMQMDFAGIQIFVCK